MIDILKMQR